MNLKYGLLLAFLVIITACLEKKEILDISTHPSGWMIQSSENFHGNTVKSSGLKIKSESCQTCHGTNYDGGTSHVSCYDAQCHVVYPHTEGYGDPTSSGFHDNLIGEQVKWDITVCRECHGADYAGDGDQEKNCLKCHNQADGPEACNTCHGSSVNNAPPEDLAGSETTTNIGVGAHQSHLTESTLTTAYELECSICHIEPAIYNMSGHVDDSSPHAELNFNAFASNSGELSPQWDHDAATCNNVYCHGAFTFYKDSSQYAWLYTDSVITGNNSNVVWNSVGTGEAACGSCHGLPPQGHAALPKCNNCHKHIGPDLEILDKNLHINGKIEVY